MNFFDGGSMPHTEEYIRKHVAGGGADDVMIALGRSEGDAYRFFCSNRGEGVLSAATLCDMMSVTKVLSVTPIAMLAIHEGKLHLDDTLDDLFDGVPEDKKKITVLQLMTHQSGMRHVFLDRVYGPFERQAAAEFLLNRPLAYPTGSGYEYCCGNMILLGFALEKIYHQPLDMLFHNIVARPLGMTHTQFLLPEDSDHIVNTLRPYIGENACSDPSARRLNGVSGNAGIFSCLEDMEKFARSLLHGLPEILPAETFALMRRNYTPDFSESRALGFLFVDEKYPQTGRLFTKGSLGHCGHSGTSVFVDYERGFFAVVLSNTTKCAANRGLSYNETMNFRKCLHNAVADDLGL